MSLLLVVLSFPARSQEVIQSWEGEPPLGVLALVAAVGDLDGDGIPDLAMGNTVLVRAVSGSMFETIWEHDLSVFAIFWTRITGIGDFDGDGVPDVALQNWASDGGDSLGRVHILSGATGERFLTLEGEIFNERLGWRVADAGDLDGNGYDDVLVSSRNGAIVRVFGGPDGRLIRRHVGQWINHSFTTVAGVGDVDGDGTPDYIIGWPKNSLPGGGASSAGRVTLYSGLDGSEIFSVYGDTPFGFPYLGDHLGRSVTGMGDVDGDGIPDFAAGAPGTGDQADGHGPGYVRIYSGLDGHVLLHVEPQANIGVNTSFGWEVGGGVDLSGDGVPDLLAAQPRENGPGATSGIQGAMNVICGRTGARLWKLYGTPGTTEKFGDRFDLLTDLTGDGIGEFLAVNQQWKNAAGETAGKAWLYAGALGSVDRFCPAELNSTGQAARIGTVGAISVGNDELKLKVEGAVPGDMALFFLSASEQPPLPFGDGQLCLAPPILRLTPAATDEDGELVQAFPFGSGHGALVTPGSTWHFQTWYRDPASPASYNLSDALRILFTP